MKGGKMRERFINKGFRPESLEKIKIINGILSEYQASGYDLTIRQLYYQLVARGFIENNQQSYKRTADLVNNARLAGFIDWAMIIDRGRETVTPPTWNDPGEIIRTAAYQFRLDPWKDQNSYIEVMVEKQALEGVLIPVCNQWGVRFTANKGYSSSSTLYETGKRLAAIEPDKTRFILYLGDHDPSGLDMTRDIKERLTMFSGDHVTIERLALNYDQVLALKPPENPAKESDARFYDYVSQYGYASWELDAIEPRALADLVTNAIKDKITDPQAWENTKKLQTAMTGQLLDIANQYE